MDRTNNANNCALVTTEYLERDDHRHDPIQRTIPANHHPNQKSGFSNKVNMFVFL
jgi:hypothetical protein